MPPGQFRRMICVSRGLQHPYGRHDIEICAPGASSAPFPHPQTIINASSCGGPATAAAGNDAC